MKTPRVASIIVLHEKFVVSSLPQRNRVLVTVVTLLTAAVVAFICRKRLGALHPASGWAVTAFELKFSLTQDASAGAYYQRTALAPLPLATVVQEMRREWPNLSLALIHETALEVGTGLLHRSDIEAGEIIAGKFVPLDAASWKINERMRTEIRTSPTLFQNENVYVFRRK